MTVSLSLICFSHHRISTDVFSTTRRDLLRITPETAIKRKDAKNAEERKGKDRETILTGLVIFVLALRP
jgi:hypothetical protein